MVARRPRSAASRRRHSATRSEAPLPPGAPARGALAVRGANQPAGFAFAHDFRGAAGGGGKRREAEREPLQIHDPESLVGRGDYQQAALPEERGERLGSEHSLEGHAPAEVGGGGSPARPVGIAGVDILTSRDRKRPFGNGGHRFQHFEQPFPGDEVRDEGRRERSGSAGRDLAGAGERR